MRSYCIWITALLTAAMLCTGRADARSADMKGSDTLKTADKAYIAMSAEDYVSMREKENRNFWQRIYHYFADANKKNDKKFDVSVIGGPHYSSNTKLGIGVVAAGVYSTNREIPLHPCLMSLFTVMLPLPDIIL